MLSVLSKVHCGSIQKFNPVDGVSLKILRIFQTCPLDSLEWFLHAMAKSPLHDTAYQYSGEHKAILQATHSGG